MSSRRTRAPLAASLETLCDRVVAWLEPGVGRDLDLDPEALRRHAHEHLLPPVLAAGAEHGAADEVGALASLVPPPHETSPRPGFIGRGRRVHGELEAWLMHRLEAIVQRELLDLEGLREARAAGALAERVTRAEGLRAAGLALIAGLVGIEEARRGCWLRPKRPVTAGWCVSLGLLPEPLGSALLEHPALREGWAERLGLGADALASLPPERRRHLVVDTRRLEPALAERVEATIPPEHVAAASLAIRADNADALRWLTREGPRPRCIFIDPPYNTGGNDFDYDDLYPGDSWAVMMGERLALARALLEPQGVLVATIDDGEVARLRGLVEAAFGPENFVTQAVWHKKYARQNDATWFSTSHDHVLVTARSKASWRPNRVPRSAAQNRAYRNPDDDPRGPWQSVVYTCAKTAEQRPNLYYPIVHPRTGAEVWPERNRVWAFSREAHARNEQEGRVWWGRDGERDKPRQKVFLRDVDRGVVPDTLWTREQVGDNQEAQRELVALFGRGGSFATPKPRRLLERVITLGSSPGDCVLDFFAGSGTTAHAVLELERGREGPRRRFVVVESGETFETVLVPRIEKVGFAREWDDGRPVGGGGTQVVCRVLELESYDDAMAEARAAADPLRRLLGLE